MVNFHDIYKELNELCKGICDSAYPENRPESVQEKINTFLVFSFPSIFNWDLVGSEDFTTTMELEIFVRDKMSKSSPNIIKSEEMGRIVEKVMAKFPYKSEKGWRVGKTRQLIVNKTDGKGFHFTSLYLEVKTW